MTASLSSSIQIGEFVLAALKPFNRLHKKRVEQASFIVLKSPTFPRFWWRLALFRTQVKLQGSLLDHIRRNWLGRFSKGLIPTLAATHRQEPCWPHDQLSRASRRSLTKSNEGTRCRKSRNDFKSLPGRSKRRMRYALTPYELVRCSRSPEHDSHQTVNAASGEPNRRR